ncbi:hypothetical protein [Nocardia cyriacigeorgica]|uniref:hypothetical protein n=1 Tax=Nocardia cyriacigeorgica TaxID=135487 RepID=UPI002458D689|nr:hypothetical protein [Nocardia cyriacigeorgica]
MSMEPIKLEPIPQYEPPAVPADEFTPAPESGQAWARWCAERATTPHEGPA